MGLRLFFSLSRVKAPSLFLSRVKTLLFLLVGLRVRLLLLWVLLGQANKVDENISLLCGLRGTVALIILLRLFSPPCLSDSC